MKGKSMIRTACTFLLVAVLTVMAFIRGPEQFWVLAGVFAVWGAWMLVAVLFMNRTAIQTRCSAVRLKRKRTEELHQMAPTPASMCEDEDVPIPAGQVMLLHVGHRISAYLKSAYPDAAWDWCGKSPECTIIEGGVLRMLDLAKEAEMTDAQREDFAAALTSATIDYSRTPSEENLEIIRVCGGIKCATGQKSSRIINKLCKKFGVDILPRYNSVFARLADSLNPVIIHKTGVLSIHPCDFLEMSNKDDAWHSCHCLADGAWQAGCLSYMADTVSMVFFTVDENVTEQFHKVPRITREIFCFNEGTLMQPRLYPSDDNEQRILYRHLVQKAIADCLGVPNLWSTMKQLNDIRDYMLTTTGSLHYADYNNGYAILFLLKETEEHGKLQIGNRAICTCCGRALNSKSTLKCSSCISMVVCKDCGEAVSLENARYINDAWHCKACLHICGFCGQALHDELYPAFDGRGREIQVCAHCQELLQTPCGTCSVRAVCGIIQGTKFCMRTASAVAVPARAA